MSTHTIVDIHSLHDDDTQLVYVIDGDSHASSDCPSARPGGVTIPWADSMNAWPCSTCIDVPVRRVFPHVDGVSIDAPERGTARTSTTTTTTHTQSERTASWAKDDDRWLVRVPVEAAAKSGESVVVHKRSGETQNVELGQLVRTRAGWAIFEPAAKSSDSKSSDESYRWRKIDGVWRVVGPVAQGWEIGGVQITVTKASGEQQLVEIVSSTAPGVYDVRQCSAVAASSTSSSSERVEIVDGRFYRTASGAIVKACESKAGRLYGKILDETSGKFEYVASALRDVVAALTLEEAKAFGVRTGRCCVCARELTKPESIEAGIGPICASKF